MKTSLFCLLIFLSFICTVFVYAADDDGIFTAAGVQFEISLEVYRSSQAFFGEVERCIEEVSADTAPDMIVFPEYIGVFYQLITFNSIIKRNTTFQDALVEVLTVEPELGGIVDLFIKPEAWIEYQRGWSALAKKYGTTIVAGSCFVPEEDGRLRNRSFVFGPDGRLVYSQDKVYLTDFETQIVGLVPGQIEDVDFFKVDGRDIALTICRDTYLREWEQKHSGAFLWVDIKANGETYNADQRRNFLKALPMRLAGSDVNLGMTVCAVGSYLDLFWEGESSAIYKVGDKLMLADKSDSYNREDYIIFKIRKEQ